MSESKLLTDKEWRALSPETRHKLNLYVQENERKMEGDEMDRLVEWYYCYRCGKDVETRLAANISSVPALSTGPVVVGVDAMCVDCGNVVASGEADVQLR